MNKSVCEIFIYGMRPWSTFTGHTQPSPKIWFKMEQFEILSFRALGSYFGLFTSWAWNEFKSQFPWILEICKVYMDSTRRDEQNPEIVSKSEKFDFSTNFVSKLSFRKNRGKICLTQWEKVAINSIRDIKYWNFSIKPWPSPSPVNLLTPQTDGTEIRFLVVSESVSR